MISRAPNGSEIAIFRYHKHLLVLQNLYHKSNVWTQIYWCYEFQKFGDMFNYYV